MSHLLQALNNERKVPYKDRIKILELAPDPVYDDGRTKQSFKDETDINKIMERFTVTGTITHLEKHEAVYGDFSDFDFHTQTRMLTRGREIFDDLPAELRQEFAQSPAAFFKYVNDPDNADELREKLSVLAAPGRQLPTPEPDPDPAEPTPEEPTP